MGDAVHNLGRPSTFTQELADEICQRLSDGETLASICRDDHMPAVRTVSHWTDKHSEFKADFAHAREEGFDAIAAETLEIADDSRNDFIEKLADNGDSKAQEARSNGEHIQRSKLRVETRLKLLSKWSKRYSDKSEVAVDATVRASVAYQANMPKRD